MKSLWRIFIGAFFILAGALAPANGTAEILAVAFPHGVKAVWDFAKAEHPTMPTRERICINGLWRWQPAEQRPPKCRPRTGAISKFPAAGPASPTICRKTARRCSATPSWKNDSLASTTMAWYEREIVVPSDWAGRRIVVSAEYVNSFAAVYVDGKKAGDIQFPGGEAD